jgi:hypothetical protein
MSGFYWQVSIPDKTPTPSEGENSLLFMWFLFLDVGL